MLKRLAGLGIAVGSGVTINVHSSGVLNERPREHVPPAIVVHHPLSISDPDGQYEIVDNKNASCPQMGATEPEMTMALEIIKERPDVLVDFLPGDRASASRHVARLFEDCDFMNVVDSKLRVENEKFKAAGKIAGSFHADLDDATIKWERLISLYKCTVCQDVLAMPHAVNCSHSFCGSCLHALRTRCQPCDEASKNTVIVDCPTCREEICHASFERTLDESILKLVDNIPDCVMKTDYLQRRADFQKVQDAAQEKDKLHSAPHPPRRAATHASANAGEEEVDEDWELFKQYIVPALMFATMVVVAVLRARK